MKRYIRSAIYNIADEDYNTRWELAKSPDTSPEILAQLAEDYEPQISYKALHNPSTPPEVLKKFVDTAPTSYDYNSGTKAEIAMTNPSMPVEVLSNLDKYKRLWDAIAVNKSTPKRTLVRLIELADSTHDLQLLSNIAMNPNAPKQFLSRMINTNSSPNYWALAKNPKLSHTMQVKLAKSDDRWVRENLASNPGVSTDILQKLCNDADRSVRDYAEYNLADRGLL